MPMSKGVVDRSVGYAAIHVGKNLRSHLLQSRTHGHEVVLAATSGKLQWWCGEAVVAAMLEAGVLRVRYVGADG